MSIQVPPDSTGKLVETNSPDGATQRQVISIGDTATAAAVAKIQNADPGTTDYGITVRDVRGTPTNPVRVDPTGSTTQPVSGTVTANAGTGTFAVSAASLPLPSGASTAAKQPALGTAGTASADVITVQGKTGMTALVVDGSAVTQPVSGTVTANAGSGTFHIQSNASVNLNQVGDSVSDFGQDAMA